MADQHYGLKEGAERVNLIARVNLEAQRMVLGVRRTHPERMSQAVFLVGKSLCIVPGGTLAGVTVKGFLTEPGSERRIELVVPQYTLAEKEIE
ncbi:MAG: hypothetical protein QM757_26465 [Paludibaculum sp.]